MTTLLATDPGAWNIIAWIVVVSAVGAMVLWIVTTFLLRDGSEEPRRSPESR